MNVAADTHEVRRRAVLIYDASCPLCTGAALWVAKRVCADALELLPCQSAGRTIRFAEIDKAACLDAMHLVLADGRIVTGHEALPHLFAMMRGWRWAARVFAWPGIRRVSPWLYRWVARHRRALSVFVWRKSERTEDG
ncbi:MAG TPA: DUF393 domain-containing protein [Candidatus Hydrogenedentes bacterium]|nr:DUF393 domain-containing protein [Candidatus Hydrogenedentota bacterium]HPG66588.1 DUF393 domain-containing protein [Candidatus Hydrogenedentota bacterium]